MDLYDALTCRDGFWRMHPLDPPEPFLDSLVDDGLMQLSSHVWTDQTIFTYNVTPDGFARLEQLRNAASNAASNAAVLSWNRVTNGGSK